MEVPGFLSASVECMLASAYLSLRMAVGNEDLPELILTSYC